MEAIIGTIFGLLALVTQSQPLPQDFIEGATTRSEPYRTETKVGLRWSCDYEGTPEHALRPSELMAEPLGMQNDYCYAALDLVTLKPVTGP